MTNPFFHTKVLIAIAIVLFAAGGYVVKTRMTSEGAPSPSPFASFLPKGDVVMIGEFICLMQADTATRECVVYGLKGDDGFTYVLDLSKFPGTPWPTPDGQRISVEATPMSDEEVREHGWHTYDAKGVLTAWVVLKI